MLPKIRTSGPGPKTALLWFRRDLRLSDNAALIAALGAADIVVPVYIHSPQEEGEWAPGAASRWWLHHSLAALERQLEKYGSRLIIRVGSSLEILRQLIAGTGAAAVHWNRLYEPAIVARDAQVKAGLEGEGIEAESHAAALLAEPGQVTRRDGAPYRVFSPFWSTLQARVVVEPPERRPGQLRAPASWPAGTALSALGLLPQLNWADGFMDRWRPGEAGALTRLRTFCDEAVPDYAVRRNYPAQSGVSRLSPHLHFGEVSPRQVWHAVRNEMDEPATEQSARAYLRELGWRDFAHHLLFHFPQTATEPLYERYRPFPWRENAACLLAAWQRGCTGYPLVDAGMRELWETGWMHNRVRMIAASFLVKNLRVHWLEGARWFWDTLVDADLANNTLGWQWSAGCGADAAPYFRIFNPMTQGARFDPDGRYIRRWVPELAAVPDKYLYCPWRMPARLRQQCGVEIGRDYPEPVVDYQASRAEALEALAALKTADSTGGG